MLVSQIKLLSHNLQQSGNMNNTQLFVIWLFLTKGAFFNSDGTLNGKKTIKIKLENL